MTRTLIELTALWYKKLKDSGFEDIEDENQEYLKSWTGISIHVSIASGVEADKESKPANNSVEFVDLVDLLYSQEPLKEIQTSFPEPLLTEMESLFHHPRLDKVCKNICSHGRHKLKPKNIKQILTLHIEGISQREIARRLEINDTLIHRTIQTLTQWSKVMPEETPEDIQDIKVVTIREFDEEIDIPFIFTTWRNTLWYDSERDPRKETQFHKAANQQIRRILNYPNTSIRMACLKEDPTFLLGYAVITYLTNLEWIYVKFDEREKGIGRLLTRNIKTVSYPTTKLGEQIVNEKNLEIKD